jgi:hypothetical protein
LHTKATTWWEYAGSCSVVSTRKVMYVFAIKDIFFLVNNHFDVTVRCFILSELVEELSKRTKEEHPLGVVIFTKLMAFYYLLNKRSA